MLLKILTELAYILNIDIEETMETLMQSDKASRQPIIIHYALNDFDQNGQNNPKFAFFSAMAS